MSQHGQVSRLQGSPVDAGSSLAGLLDPVALEARLVEARARRAEAIARRAAGLAPAERSHGKSPLPGVPAAEAAGEAPAHAAGPAPASGPQPPLGAQRQPPTVPPRRPPHAPQQRAPESSPEGRSVSRGRPPLPAPPPRLSRTAEQPAPPPLAVEPLRAPPRTFPDTRNGRGAGRGALRLGATFAAGVAGATCLLLLGPPALRGWVGLEPAAVTSEPAVTPPGADAPPIATTTASAIPASDAVTASPSLPAPNTPAFDANPGRSEDALAASLGAAAQPESEPAAIPAGQAGGVPIAAGAAPTAPAAPVVATPPNRPAAPTAPLPAMNPAYLAVTASGETAPAPQTRSVDPRPALRFAGGVPGGGTPRASLVLPASAPAEPVAVAYALAPPAAPSSQPASASPARAKPARPTPARSTPARAASNRAAAAPARAAPAEEVERIILERTVEGMLRDHLRGN